MKFNTNSNTYTIVYAAITVVIVAFLLAFVSSALKERSEANERIDTKRQILASLIDVSNIADADIESTYLQYIQADEIVNDKGDILKAGADKDKDGFAVSRKEIGADNLPFYVCQVDSQSLYVIPMVGKGLWGTIWGYVALKADGKTVHGTYFSHESETAGLGSLIKEAPFQKQFEGKTAFDETGTAVLRVVKSGQVKDPQTQCDGISGATLTSNGVDQMIQDYLNLYKARLAKSTASTFEDTENE